MMLAVKTIVPLLVAVAAVLSITDYLAWRADHARLVALATESGLLLHQPEVETELRRETVSARAATKLAWSLLDLEVDRSWLSDLSPDEREAETLLGRERLRLARQLAEDVLLRQPASWQAATVLGASRYLEALRGHRRDQPIAAWREPLLAAMRLAPSYPEPPIFLASAYFSRWSSLPPAGRDELLPVLTRAFEDRRGLEILIPPWVRLAPSLRRLLEPIPDRPAAWHALGREFLRLGDLERFGLARGRQLESLPADLEDRLQKGRARVRGGHNRAALHFLRPVFAAPPDLAYVDSFSAALAALPAEELRSSQKELERWLGWARDLCAVERCPLDAETMTGLAATTGQTTALDPPDGEIDHPARLGWSRDDWQARGASYRLFLRTARPTRGLHLEMDSIPARGAAIELRWDGRALGVEAIEPGEPLVWSFQAGPGLHLLEVTHLSGRPLAPGDLTLEPASSSG
jgi:tetratricopeptide (TPR) repeat protein